MSVETNHQTYSSEAMLGGISITDRPMEYRRASFISMDPPKHDEQRKVVSPIVAPMNLNKLSATIRERAGEHPRRAAAQRDVRLGAARVDRADHPDADDADGLPVRGSPQAGLLVGLRDRRCERRHRRRFRGEAAGDPDRGAGVLHRTLARARRGGTAARSDLDAGAWRVDARPDQPAAGVPGQPDAADRRRQRDDAQFDLGRRVGAEPLSRRVSQAARQSRPDPEPGAGGHPLADAGDAHAAHRAGRRRDRRQARSARATRW